MTIVVLTQAKMLIFRTLDSKATGTANGSKAIKKAKAVDTYMLGHNQFERHPSKI
jgi:hypothetical protein